ncbi:MAG: transglutaminase-like cysteine peptidase [Patescibacteria group bacterium]
MRLSCSLLLAALCVLPAGAQAQTTEPFGLRTTSVTNTDVRKYEFLKQKLWPRFRRQMDADENKVFACEQVPQLCTPATTWFLQLARAASLMHGVAQLEWLSFEVRRQVTYTSDKVLWGEIEHWSPALETLGRRWARGDCEDYVFLWKAILEKVGVKDSLVLAVRVLPRHPQPFINDSHAVLAVPVGGSWYLLDNRLPVRKDTQARDYKPLFILDDNGVRKYLPHVPPAAEPKIAAR